MHKNLLTFVNDNPWSHSDDHEDGLLWLVTPKELEALPDGTKLESISGDSVTKGVDSIDKDTRGGLMAYGIRGHC